MLTALETPVASQVTYAVDDQHGTKAHVFRLRHARECEALLEDSHFSSSSAVFVID